MLWDLQMLEPDPIAIEENVPIVHFLVLIAIMWNSIQWVTMWTKALLQAYRGLTICLLN